MDEINFSESPDDFDPQVLDLLVAAAGSLVRGENRTLYAHELTAILDYIRSGSPDRFGAVLQDAIVLIARLATIPGADSVDNDEAVRRALAVLDAATQMIRLHRGQG